MVRARQFALGLGAIDPLVIRREIGQLPGQTIVGRVASRELNEDSMSTQPSLVNPAIPAHLEPYVDSKQAAVFLAFDWKKVQKLSREGTIPAHPVLSGPRNRRRTWRYKLSELDQWARTQRNSTPAGSATSPKEK